MSLQKLLSKAKVYDFSESNEISKETGRLDFITKFPLERLSSLSIDEYVAGTDNNSFSYWLEFKKILFGIGGGSASKFAIYKIPDSDLIISWQSDKVAYDLMLENDAGNILKVAESKVKYLKTIKK
jgi:5-methylcytosine-specific restriction protein B